MGIKNVIEVVKQVHKEEIVFVKIGKFYQVYGKDAYIVSYLFEYKLKKVEEVHVLNSSYLAMARMNRFEKI